MYAYDEFDERFVRERVAQFRDQVERRLSGALTDDEFKPLRLKNGVYLQLHAYMLRIAIPYGTLSAAQLRQLAMIGDRYDRGYGHFTTRQNLQFNWPKLKDIPDILDHLADVQMHAIQTSGNCIRNVTADHFAGVAEGEVEDPRITGELLRQWSSLHPEFSYLPRKFKIAVTGCDHDRAVIKAHDIGLRVLRNAAGEIGYEVVVGGGLGRTPMIGQVIRPFLPRAALLAYLQAILRVYNLEGRRDNKYKARIKILVHETGIEALRQKVEEEFARTDLSFFQHDAEELERISAFFAAPALAARPARSNALDKAAAVSPDLEAFVAHNVHPHKQAGYGIVTISLKAPGEIPGDATTDQMRFVADLADRYSLGEIRVSHRQNLILPHVALDNVPELFAALQGQGLATGNAGLITDIIACPGLDYCALATARSIPIAQAISTHFADQKRQEAIGPLDIKISGCINACGHHHVGHIGILGLEKRGIESYQITVGGDATEAAAIGELVGPGIPGEAVPAAMEVLIGVYEREKQGAETFIQTVKRVGHGPFKTAFKAFAEEIDHAAA